MRWIAPAMALLLAGMFIPAVDAQISATPAPRFTPSGQLVTPAGGAPTATGPLAAATAFRSPEADQIRAWYRDYLGRDVGADLSSWVELLRGGMSAVDVQASILGSDEFYYQKGRDPQSFVRETLQAITWAEPTLNEVQRWTDRLAQLRGDHFTLAREILLANTQSSSTAPVNQIGDIATRLTAAARLAVDTIDFEIGGTAQGRQANLQAQSLTSATNQFQRTVSTVSYRPDDALLSLNSADRAFQALQATLSNPPGTAPSAAGIVRRIGTMLADARNTIRPTTIPTYPTQPGNGGYNPQQLLDQVTAARRATESLIQTLTSQAYQNYSYSVVLRDLDTLASRLTGLDQLVRSSTSRDRISWEVQSLADIANRIRTQLLAGRPPYSVRLYWQSVESSLAQMRETLGNVAGSDGSVVLRPTPLHDNLLPLLDQAASQIDMFLAGINPLVFSIADVPSVQRDARNLKSRVFTMRQQAVAGEPASALKQTLSMMVGDYQDAYERWNRIVASYRLINPAKLSPIGETLNRVEQMINDALASGDLTPTGPTRVTQNLSLLSSEVTDARSTLSLFAGYREQQSIDLYLEQLAGYVQSIGDSLGRSTTVDARRLAVAMQGVIGRMQVEIDSLNQRTAAAGTRDQQNYASDLRTRAYRIGKLVDDIEADLY